MKIISAVVALAGLALVSAGQAEAKGCIKGALVGGLAGHMVGHGGMGAAAGCAVGHSRSSSKQDRQNNQMQQPANTGSTRAQ